MAGLREFDVLARLLDHGVGDFDVPSADRDLPLFGQRLGQLRLGQFDVRPGRGVRPGHLVGPARGDRLLLGQGGEPVVLLFGEDVVRLGRLQPGPGLVNAPRDLLAGELERLVGLGPVGPGGRLAPLRDLDL